MNAQVDISNTVLETERLFLRPWKQDDVEDLYEYASVDGVGQMAGWTPHENIEESQQILDLFIQEKKTIALVDKESGKVIGSLGLEAIEYKYIEEKFADKKGREIGYVLCKDYWGKGLMVEAVNRVIEFTFTELGWDYLLCNHFNENHQSQSVMEKCGFQYLMDSKTETTWGEEKEGKLHLLENKR